MTAYEQLMALRATRANPEQQQGSAVDRVIAKTTKVVRESYARTVAQVAEVYEAAEQNVMTTPDLWEIGRLRARERTAQMLLDIMNGK